MAEFEAHRSTRFGRSLLALAALGELRSSAGEAFFGRLLSERFPIDDPAALDRTIAYHMKAVHGLGYMFTRTSDRFLQHVMVAHPFVAVRSEAIRAYVFNQPASVRDALRSRVREEESVLVDRFEHRNYAGNTFDERLEAFLQSHPELTE